MKRMEVIDSRKYYPKVGVGFRTDGEDGDPNAETTKRPLIEEAAEKYGFRIVDVTRERDEGPSIEYCIFSLEGKMPVKCHESWWGKIHKVTDMLPNCMHSYTLSPWQLNNLTSYLNACRLQHKKLELDDRSSLYGVAERVEKAMQSAHDYISREDLPSNEDSCGRKSFDIFETCCSIIWIGYTRTLSTWRDDVLVRVFGTS